MNVNDSRAYVIINVRIPLVDTNARAPLTRYNMLMDYCVSQRSDHTQVNIQPTTTGIKRYCSIWGLTQDLVIIL